MQNPGPNSSELDATSVTSAPCTNDSLDETLCAVAEETASLDKLLKAAAQLPVPSAAEEQQWAGVLSRVQDLDFVRKQSRTMSDGSSSENAPDTLGPFELLERLGEGGMGAVYRARHLRLGKLMAVKVMHAHRLDDQELRSRFYREMRALGQLQHPNIVSAQHADEVDGVPYLAMEYVDGISLASLFQQLTAEEKPIPIAVVCELIRQAADGIQYAHDQGVLHRDLKPGNLMLDRDGRVRVLDLGLARMTESIDSAESTGNDEHLTSQHQILGTPGYMAPEQLTRGHEMDTRTDVYALGATAFYLLTGKRVHAYSNSESIVQHAMRVVAECAPDVRTLRKDVPEELAQVIAQTLEREPNQRLQSAGELARRMSRWSSKESLSGLWTNGVASVDGTSGSMLDTERLPESAFPSRPTAAEAATVIMPAVEPRKSGGSNGRLRAVWLIPAGFFAIVLLAGVLLKLRTKDGGELIIQSDDPDARISITAVNGEQSEELQLVEQDDRTLKLTQGKWAIHLAGPEALGFELSENTVVVSPGSLHEIRVTRRKGGDTVARTDALKAADMQSAEGRNGNSSTTMSSEKRADTGRSADNSTPLAPNINNASVIDNKSDWSPGRIENDSWGLVPQPATLDSVATWQMQLLRSPTGISNFWDDDRRASLDPQRELVAWCDDYGARVLRIADGRVVSYFRCPEAETWHTIAFSSDGQHLVLASHQQIQVRDRNGRLVGQFQPSKQLFQYRHSFLRATWTSDGHILVWTLSGAAIYTRDAQLRHELIIYDEARTPWLEHVAVHPDGNRFLFSGVDANIYKWTLGEKTLTKFMTRDEAILSRAMWSPKGDRILVVTHNGPALPNILDSDGNLQCTAKSMFASAAWSPDGRFLIDDHRRIYSTETFEIVRTLELPEGHPQAAGVFSPFWLAAEEIVCVSRSSGRDYANGSILRFHPSGRQLPSPETPQPLSIGAATLSQGDSVQAVHLATQAFSGLSRWSKSGEALGVVFTDLRQPVQYSFSWNRTDGRIAVGHPGTGPLSILNSEGKTVRTIPGAATFAWSGDGKWLAVDDRSKGQFGCLSVYGDSDAPVFQSDPFTGYIFAPIWSPDGRWLIWDVVDDSRQQYATVNILDMNADTKSVQSLVIPSFAGIRWAAFSPDSQWLAVQNNAPTEREATLIRMSDFKEFKQPVNCRTNGVHALSGCWSADSKRVLLGDVFDVSSDSGLTRRGAIGCDPARLQLAAFSPDNQAVWMQSPTESKFGVRNFDDLVVSEFGVSGRMLPGHSDATQAKLQSPESLLFISNPIQSGEHAVETGLIDLIEPGLRWIGLAFDDGKQITLSPGGEILHGAESIDRYVIHTINYPGGVTMPVTRHELVDRAGAGPAQKAMLWASDLRALIRTHDRTEPWSAIPALAAVDYPSANLVVELDFSGHLQIADAELQHLSHFSGLVKLSLARTSLSTIPDCHSLSQLAELDLSHTRIASLAGLRNCQSLRKLELSGLALDASSWQIIASLAGLETLNLSRTPLDGLSALELFALKDLKHLDLRGTKLSESDVAAIQSALPGCQVLSGPMAEPEM